MLRRAGVAAALIAMTSMAGCGEDTESGSSNRGSGTDTNPISVEDAFIVPRSINAFCSLQVGDSASMRYAVSNSSTTAGDQLVGIRTDEAARVETTPSLPIAVGVAAIVRSDVGSGAQLSTRLVGLTNSARPGISFDVTFRFATVGDVVVRVPVEACPAS